MLTVFKFKQEETMPIGAEENGIQFKKIYTVKPYIVLYRNRVLRVLHYTSVVCISICMHVCYRQQLSVE